MQFTRMQRLFIRLSTNQRKRWGSFPPNYRKRKVNKKYPENRVKVDVVSAITGERTTAYAYDNSVPKFKKWLKLRNIRAQFADMEIPKKSTWNYLTEDDFKGYPLIIKLGTYQTPYIIDHIGTPRVQNGKNVCNIFLETTDNVDYLVIISQKREMVDKLIQKYNIKITKKKKKKTK